MPGRKFTLRGKSAAVLAAAVACCALVFSLSAGGAGAADFSFDCSHDATHVTQTQNQLHARGKLQCTGNGIRRQVIRVCLLQQKPAGLRSVKCVTRARNGSGTVTADATRTCAKGPLTGFVTRIKVRIKQTDGDVTTDSSRSSPNHFPRNCRT
jgi:hypothetical protein